MDCNSDAIETIYRQRADDFFATEGRYTAREQLVTRLRVATFLAAAVMFLLGWNTAGGRWWHAGGGIAIAAFVAAVVYHEHVREQIRRYAALGRINQQAIARLHRNWTALPETPTVVPTQHEATSLDLDLFGHASLFHLVCTANTPAGIRTLRDWLLEPASPEEIKRRQEAVVDLAPHLDLRQALMLEGRFLADRGKAMERFVDWAEGGCWLAARPWLYWLVRILNAAVVLILALTCAGVLSADLAGLAFLVVVFLNINVIAVFGGKVHGIFSALNARRGEAARYLRMFELMYAMPGLSAQLAFLKQEATRLDGGVRLRMRQLRWLAILAMLRHEAFLLVILYLPLQLIFLYDFHVLRRLEAWQAKHGRFVRRWYLALSEFEALCSLATLPHDHPGWTLPEVDAAAERFKARQLGHPLLAGELCVTNDVEVGPAGSFLLVTGSNMSGKSTLLRAIGVNAVLAQAGAPVCAGRLTMPPLALATSMRIRDSLEDGVSFYMAELMRLKEIVDHARDHAARDGRLLLYLLDEILLGTNSRERHLAVVRVTQHLVRRGAIGAISTHDLDLAASEGLAAACRCVHFCETLHDRDAERPMTFDYKLRPGIATTSNAIRLLEMVGLDGGDERP